MNINTDTLESLVKRYVLGQLDETQAEEFEAFYLSRPDVIEMIESVQRLHIGMQNLEAEAPLAAAVKRPRRSLGSRIVEWLSVPVPAYAMLLVALISGPLLLRDAQPDRFGEQVKLVMLDSSAVRSINERGGVNLSADGKYAALVIRVKVVDYPSYQLVVKSADTREPVWTSDPFQFASGSRDYLVTVPPSAALENARVELLGITEQAQFVPVEFCNYTEACF